MTKPKSRTVVPMSASVWILLCLSGSSAQAHHPEDACPDTHVYGDQSGHGKVLNNNTNQEYADGTQLPVGTQLKMCGDAQTSGYCDIYIASGSGCFFYTRSFRDLIAMNFFETPVDGRTTIQESRGFLSTPGQPMSYDWCAVPQYTNAQNELSPGAVQYKFRVTANSTTCALTPNMSWAPPVTIYFYDDLRCPEGDVNSDVGNPCNAGTGNKHESDIDYDAPGAMLRLERSYNSLLPLDFGLGHGWITNFHRRLERYETNTIRVRRGNAAGEKFTKAGSTWSGYTDVKYALTEDATGYTVTLRTGASERYDLTGKILSETDPVGRVTTYTYASDRLQSVQGPFGHTLTFSYFADGHLSGVTDPAGGVIAYSYDANNNLATVIRQDGRMRTYHYEVAGYPSHGLTGITDENGDRFSTYAYDGTSGKATLTQRVQTTNATPQDRWTLTYTSSTKTTVVDPAGNSEVLTFASQFGQKNLLSRISSVDSKGFTQTFDANNNLDVHTDAEGHKTKYTYNGTNQRISMIEAYQTPQARTTIYEYLLSTEDLVKKVITSSVAGGQQKKIITNYNANRTIASIVTEGFRPDGAPISRATSMQYNAQGQVTQIDGPRTDVSDVTYIEYYECAVGGQCGHLKKITNAAGHISSFDTYDAHGHVTQTTDPNGLITSYTYDLRGRVVTATAGSRTTTLMYTNAGQIESVTRPNGQVLTYGYDAAHDLRSITDNLGNEITYSYDVRGNRKTEETLDPGNMLTRTISYTYDLRNRIDAINAAGSITDLVFDAVGNLKQETDPNSNTTTHIYDPLNRMTQTLDALSGTTTFSHSIQDQITQVQVPNNASTTYVYDDLGNLLEQSSPDTGTTTYEYDAANNRNLMTDARGVTVSYAYDALNRLASITFPTSALDRSFTYDGGVNQKGQLTGLSDASGSTAYTYNLHGELTGAGRIISGNTFSTGHGYDTAGQQVTQTYPASGRVVTYTRDALGRFTDVTTTLAGATTPIASNIQYLPYGPVAGLTLGNGIVLGRLHDQQYRLDYISDAGASALRDHSYAYDPAGNIDQILDSLAPSKTQVFGQDVLDRITSDSSGYGAVTYLYDSAGNRTQRSRSGVIEQTISYTTNSNRISSLNSSAFTYDAAGNTLTDGPGNRAYTYDDANRLVQMRVSGVLQATYVYNANGQRVKKVEATGAQRTLYFHYGQAGELIGETIYSSGGQKIGEREYIWLETLPLAFSERTFDAGSGGVLTTLLVHLHPDHLGTPRLATDANQQVVWRWESDAFGVGAADTDPDGNGTQTAVGLRFAGQYLDSESGLHHNYFRDYDPQIGRYSISDPLSVSSHVKNMLARLGSARKPMSLLGRPNVNDPHWLKPRGIAELSQRSSALAVPLELNTYAYVANGPLRWSDPSGSIIVDHCTSLYVLCIMQRWGGDWSCNDCLFYCTGINQEWPFEHCYPNKGGVCRRP